MSKHITLESLEGRRLFSANLLADSGGFYPTDATEFNGNSYFLADDGVHGRELWRSNGTPQGTWLVKDIAPGKDSPNTISLNVVNGRLLFFTYMDNHTALWSTNGMAAGTVEIQDFGVTRTFTPFTAVINSKGTQRLVFTISHGTGEDDGAAVWSTDGTAAGTIKAGEFAYSPGPNDANYHLPVANGRVVFAVHNSTTEDGSDLWSTDGTPQGTVDITASVPELAALIGAESNPHSLVTFNGKVYFNPKDSSGELWVTDGTAAGTHEVIDLGTVNGDFGTPQIAGGKMYISQGSADHQNLWVSDGTAARTVELLTYSGWSPPTEVASYGTRALFGWTDADHGTELWITDGTIAGTHMIKDLTPGPESSYSWSPVEVGGYAFFERYITPDGDHGHFQIWRTDGTAQGTFMVQDLPQYNTIDNYYLKMAAVDGQLVATIQTLNQTYVTATYIYDPETLTTAVPKQNQVTLTDGVLRIFGTQAADNIRIHLADGDPTRLVVQLNAFTRSYGLRYVKQIVVYGYSGSDSIVVDQQFGKIAISSHIWGGSGNDTIQTGSGNDNVSGDGGNDQINTGDGNDIVTGGDGNDVITAGNGNDTANGGNGADTLYGGNGADVLSGGQDNMHDHLDGGTGADVVFGTAVYEIFFGTKQMDDPLDDMLIS